MLLLAKNTLLSGVFYRAMSLEQLSCWMVTACLSLLHTYIANMHRSCTVQN